jgi:ABC-type multidrug transport system permease subunit
MPNKGTSVWTAEFVRAFRVNPVLIYLALVPAIAAAILLAIFFFTIFLALFAVAVAVVGLHVWWLRWKLRHSRSSESFEDRYIVIKEAHLVEKETDKAVAHIHRERGSGV